MILEDFNAKVTEGANGPLGSKYRLGKNYEKGGKMVEFTESKKW